MSLTYGPASLAAYDWVMVPEVAAVDVPWVTTEQMREVDRVMVEDLGIKLIQMMENAGRSLADLAMERFSPETVTVLAGTGGNGGGAMVAARHLANRGVRVSVAVTSRQRLRPVPEQQFQILSKLDISLQPEPEDSDLIIDGVIGYSLSGDPVGRAADLTAWCSGRTVLSLDIPSGVDGTTGQIHNPHVEAVATLTLAAPKVGMREASAVGELYLADISVPPRVFRNLGFTSMDGLGTAGLVRLAL